MLVTGGAGFIGGFLCERLIARGEQVLCLDNFFTGRPGNIAQLLDHPGFELLEHDVTAPFHRDVGQIYNLACPASPVHYQSDPVRTTKVIVQGAIHLLDLARQTGARILQASTSEVYGDPEVHPQAEAYWGHVNPIGVRACYDEGKRCAETLFFDYRRQYGLEIKVARIFNTYGPRMGVDDGRVVSNFVVQALRGEPLTLHGDGSQTRSFCYVDDMVDGLVRLMATPAWVTGPMNLGAPVECSMRQLADTILEITGSRSSIAYAPLPQDDPRRRRPDIGLAERSLDWAPRTSLDEGLRRTIAWFEGALSAPQSSTGNLTQ